MGRKTAKHSLPFVSRLLSSCLSSDWLSVLFDLYRNLRQVLTRERHGGMYEILDYDTTLELIDPKGETTKGGDASAPLG